MSLDWKGQVPDPTPLPVHHAPAEVATAVTQYDLSVGDRVTAAALQPVAATAWEIVQDPFIASRSEQAAHDAEAAFAMACGMSGERHFLRDVINHVADLAAAVNATVCTQRATVPQSLKASFVRPHITIRSSPPHSSPHQRRSTITGQ